MVQNTAQVAKWPSFSLIIETENLSSAELQGLGRSLDSLSAQTIPPDCANEVLILESGDLPREMVEHLCSRYPWLTVRAIESEMDYYAAKMRGVALTTSEVTVFADSDCIYESDWLCNLLTPFGHDSTIQVVAGETTTSANGPYGLGVALTYIFPRWTGQSELRPTNSYFFNNVAFRRQFLLEHPLPADLTLYRGNCVIHAHTLKRNGIVIWRQPTARACHAAPNGGAHFFWRYVLLGYDGILIDRLRRANGQSDAYAEVRPIADLAVCLKLAAAKVVKAAGRCGQLLLEQPGCIINLPLGSLVALASLLLFFAGLLIGYLRPDFFRTPAGRVEANWELS
jgi:cellulose synthase/poly-beta-1,6-N-acetylglucosamine synthase-like glycosyltransferase